MYILSLDPGLERTGYAIFKLLKNKCYLIHADKVLTSKQQSQEKRLFIIQEKLENIIINNNIEAIVLEDLFMFKNQKTIVQVSRAQGAILSLAGKYALKTIFLTPLEIKSAITGYGRADKKSVNKMILAFFPELKTPLLDDTIDAIACGYSYYLLNRNIFTV